VETKRRLILLAPLLLLLVSPDRAGAQSPAPVPGGAAKGASSPELALGPEDLRIEERGDGGYHLYVRKKPGVSSVLLTETTKDPAMKADNYAYRAKEPNPENAGEKRLLDGKFIEDSAKIYSLIDSSPEADPLLGRAFRIFIPYVVEYGYEWSRHGEVFVANGTFVNLRTFAKPYADYAGAWKDNPFRVSVVQRQREGPPEGNYLKEAVANFTSLSESGALEYSSGEKDVVPRLKAILGRAKGRSLDLVVCLDTTESMSNDIDGVKKDLLPMLRDSISGYPSFRIGLVLYKDYFEEYLAESSEFTSDLAAFDDRVQRIKVRGGADIPEAVNEALYAAETGYPWSAEERLIVLIGDAPAHPLPRGKISEADVKRTAKALNLKINAIILPQ
jgi:Mg-chelatase subunit ChlD